MDKSLIQIFRGDDTDGLGYQSIQGKITTTLDLTGCRAVFRYLGFTQEFDPIPENGRITITMPASATSKFPPGLGYASLRVYDSEGKVRTFTNRIPVFVTVYAPSECGGEFEVVFNGGNLELEPLKIKSVNGYRIYDGYLEQMIDKATAIEYGLALLFDSGDSGKDANSGYAATPKAVQAAYDAIIGELTDNYYNAEETEEAIDRIAAYYITSDAQGNPFATYAALAGATAFYSGGQLRTPTRNDYCVVLADETHDGKQYRYIYATNQQGAGQWEAQYAVGGSVELDNTVTRISGNGVKSSGIWSAIWGTLTAVPGVSSLYDWCVAQLAGKASKSDATLTSIYSDTPTFSEWAFSGTSPSSGHHWEVIWDLVSDEYRLYEVPNGQTWEDVVDVPESVISLDDDLTTVVFPTAGVTATRTRTDIIGYVLGSQTGKPLQPKGDYAPATNIAKSALAQDVQTSLGKADTALQTAPVTSVNNKTGAVVLNTTDIQDNSTGTSLASLLSFMNGSIQGKAPLASPAFTGSPTAPTPASGDDSTKVATTAFVKSAIGGITPGPDNNKLNSTSAAPAFSTSATYAVGDYVTYQGDLYVCSTAVSTAGDWTGSTNWTAANMTSPDATFDVTSQNALRLVDANGNRLWMQGYNLETPAVTSGAATLSNESVNYVELASTASADATVTLTLPARSTGKVSDFVLDAANNSSANTLTLSLDSTALDTTFGVVVPDGETLNDMFTIAAGEMAEFYFTLTQFTKTPTGGSGTIPMYKVVKQIVVDATASQGA